MRQNIRHKAVRRAVNAHNYTRHFDPETARPQQSSCLLSWLTALAPTGRERCLGLKLVQREPLPDGVVERYTWRRVDQDA